MRRFSNGLISSLLIVGCASKDARYIPDNLKTAKIDAQGNSIYIDREGNLDERKFSRDEKKGLINKERQWSCFGDNESRNYIELSPKEISFYRAEYLGLKMKDFYHSTKRSATSFSSTKFNAGKIRIKLDTKKCILTGKKGEEYYVVSEKYRILRSK